MRPTSQCHGFKPWDHFSMRLFRGAIRSSNHMPGLPEHFSGTAVDADSKGDVSKPSFEGFCEVSRRTSKERLLARISKVDCNVG